MLVEPEVGQRGGEPVVVSGRPGQGDGFLVVSEGGVQIAGVASGAGPFQLVPGALEDLDDNDVMPRR
jgi:hypothetical protein